MSYPPPAYCYPPGPNLAPQADAAIYPQQPYQSQQYSTQQYLAPAPPPNALRKKRSAWKSVANLKAPAREQYPSPPHAYQGSGGGMPAGPVLEYQGHVGATPVAPVPENEAMDCPTAKGMNQGAALWDNIAARLNEVLSRLDSDDGKKGEIDVLVRGMAIDEARHGPQDRSTAPRDRHKHKPKPSGQSHSFVNFQKTWQYANSRLPPHLLPFKVYLPTHQILSQAAEASQAVYERPRRNEQQDYVDADWRHGTKAMVLKSVLMDEKRLVVFAIRGSKWNFVDWAVNFRPAPTQPVGFLDDPGNACHAGFLSVARAMVQPVAARLRQILEQDPSRATSSLVITGHSAGGAVASLLFMHMLSTTVSSELTALTGCFRRVHCVAFGAPPISLLPLQKPGGDRNTKNLFYSFINEGDPVVRADKQYVYSLGRLLAAQPPDTTAPSTSLAHGLRNKVSRQRLRGSEPTVSAPKPPPRPAAWPVPEAILSNAGRLVLLRRAPGQKSANEAVCLTEEQLRDRIFGDPAMHEMALYKRRIDELALAAITGRESR